MLILPIVMAWVKAKWLVTFEGKMRRHILPFLKTKVPG